MNFNTCNFELCDIGVEIGIQSINKNSKSGSFMSFFPFFNHEYLSFVLLSISLTLCTLITYVYQE